MNEIFKFAWQFFCNNFTYVASLTLPFTLLALPSYFIAHPADNKIGFRTVVGIITYLIGFAVYMSSLIFFMSQGFQKNLRSVKSNIINGLVYTPPLIATLLLANAPFLAVGIIFFTSQSLVFLTIPLIVLGIYVALRSTFAPFHLILEGYNPLESIKASFKSTEGRLKEIIFVLFTFYIATSIVEVASSASTGSALYNILMFYIGVVITLLMTAFQQIVIFRMYIGYFENKKAQ